MKKSLIALAVAATVATPMAASAAMLQAAGDQEGINLYGSIRPQWVSLKDDSITDGGSRFGIKGSHDLGNGLSSFYRIEAKVSTANADFPSGGRLAYAGLKGGWGAIAGGQQWTPYYSIVGSPSDIFASAGLSNYNDTGGPFRAGNALTYALPTGMVVGGAVMGVINGDVTNAEGDVLDNQDDLDVVSLGLTANAGPVVIGFGYNGDNQDEIGRDRIGLSVSGNLGPVFAAFMIEDTDPQPGLGGEQPWAITAQWLGIGLQYSDLDSLNEDGNKAWTLGYQYKLSAKTRIQFAYESLDWRSDDKFVARWRVDF
jgi:predicted porin